MSTRTKMYSGIAIAVVAAFALAGASLWLLQDEDVVDAQGTVTSACQSLRDTGSFVVSVDIDQVEDGEITDSGNITLRVQGDNAHWIYTFDDRTGDMMTVDGIGYYRENNAPWEIMDTALRPGGLPVSIDQIPCASLSRFAYIGDGGQVRGVSTREFSAYSDRMTPLSGARSAGSAGDAYPSSDWRIWVDRDGAIRRYTQEQSLSASMTLELDGTFDGIGTALDITAPNVPGP